MITATGYSKDPSIVPEGLVITIGQETAKNNGGYKNVLKHFLLTLENDDGYWMHKMLLFPKIEVADVYIITMNRLWGRAKFGWLEKSATFKYTPDDPGTVSWPRLVIVGPFEKCPFKRELKGFQGFRYCTKLF